MSPSHHITPIYQLCISLSIVVFSPYTAHSTDNTPLTESVRQAIISNHTDIYRKLGNASFSVSEKTGSPANKGVIYRHDFSNGSLLYARTRDQAKSIDKFKMLPMEMIFCANKDYAFRLEKQNERKPYVITYTSLSRDEVKNYIFNELSYKIHTFSTILDKPLHELLVDPKFKVLNATHSLDNGKNTLRLDVQNVSVIKEEPSYTGHIILDKDNSYSIIRLDINIRFYEINQKKEAVGQMTRDMSYAQNALRLAVPSLVKTIYVTNVYEKQEVEWFISSLSACDKTEAAFRLPAFGLTDIIKMSNGQDSSIPWFVYAAAIGSLCLIAAWFIKRKRTLPA